MQLGFAEITTVFTSCSVVKKHPPLPNFVGINGSSLSRFNKATDDKEPIDPFDVPRFMREELNIRVIDLVSTMLGTYERGPLEKLRKQADRAGCVISNLKVNIPDLRFDSDDAAKRRHGLDEYKKWIDAATVLGIRSWAFAGCGHFPPRPSRTGISW